MAIKSKKVVSVQDLPDAPEVSLNELKEEYEMVRAVHCILRAGFGIVCMRSGVTDKEAAESLTKSFDACFKYLRDTAHIIARQVNSMSDSKAS